MKKHSFLWFSLLALCLQATAMAPTPGDEFGQMSWLVGRWVTELHGRTYCETWVRENPTTLHYFKMELIPTGGKRILASAFIREMNGKIYFTNDPDEPVYVAMELTQVQPNRICFVDKTSDIQLVFELTEAGDLCIRKVSNKSIFSQVFERV